MGTNYYVRKTDCEHCGKYTEIHLGKSSMGWVFSFQYNGGKYYKNVPEMVEWTKGKNIFDEYDRPVSHDEFWTLITEKQTNPENRNHAKEYPGHGIVIDGYSFTDAEFC